MSTFSFKVSQIAIPFLAEYADALPILINTNKQLDKEFRAGTGVTMTMVIPDHPEVTDGPSLNPSIVGSDVLGYSAGSKTLTLVQRKVAIGADQVQRALDISDFRGQVAKPYAAKLASQIQKLAAKEVQLHAAHQIVLGGTKNFEEIGGLIASIRASRSYDDLFGALSPQLNSKVISSGIQFFNPSTQISDMFKSAKLGMYNTVEFYSTPDVVGLTTGTLALGSGTALKVKTTLVSGDTKLTLKVVGGTATLTGTVKAGQVFTVAGSEAVDIYGVSVGTPYAFVVLADKTASGNEIELTVDPVYVTADNRALANVSAYPVADAAVTQVHASNASYLGGIIWDKQSLMFGSAKLAPMAGTESMVSDDAPNGVSITVTHGPDIMEGREICRFDTLTGFALVRKNWAGCAWLLVA